MSDSLYTTADVRYVIHDRFGTTDAEVFVGQTLVATFNCGTRHINTAREVTDEVLADALRPLVEAAARARGLGPARDDEAEL